MKKLRFLLSLTNDDNDYQLEQAESATQAGRKTGVEVTIIYAKNDAINQSTQLLKAVQSPKELRPDAILFEPVGGTALPQVARAATKEGLGWVVLNREADYLDELRRTSSAPVFALSSDHVEVGRIQGRQIAALLRGGGSVLYIQGPSENSAAKERTAGVLETKPANVQLAMLRAQWTQETAHKSVRSWLKLTTSQRASVDLVAAQDDAMALGAKDAFKEIENEDERERWLRLPLLGCDGLPKTGQSWVRSGLLTATVFIPPNAGQAIEMLADALQNRKTPQPISLTVPVSIPALDALGRKKP